MSIQITIPSKTFLLGEYLALFGGPTLILNTEPHFTFTAKPSSRSKVTNIAAASPAGKFIQQQEKLKHYELDFIDPHQEAGGLGASSAQFLAAYLLNEYGDAVPALTDQMIHQLLDSYQNVAWDGEGLAPSGADLIAQWQGEISFFYKNQLHQATTTTDSHDVFSWPFADLSFCLIRTGNKVATHEHLRELDNFPYDDFQESVNIALTALKNSDVQQFIHAVNQYADILADKGFTAAETIELLKKIKTNSAVLAAKGCGALGADIIFILLEKKHKPEFMTWLQSENLHFVADEDCLCAGITVQK